VIFAEKKNTLRTNTAGN